MGAHPSLLAALPALFRAQRNQHLLFVSPRKHSSSSQDHLSVLTADPRFARSWCRTLQDFFPPLLSEFLQGGGAGEQPQPQLFALHERNVGTSRLKNYYILHCRF